MVAFNTNTQPSFRKSIVDKIAQEFGSMDCEDFLTFCDDHPNHPSINSFLYSVSCFKMGSDYDSSYKSKISLKWPHE